ncbi:hypothetical protein [Bacillus horti]|uniref:Integral membrane protein n=1 Tax=Caldalkalibacillus horti TaxID=77523 RepID=A0ABT9VZK0_9BACI|nr:hypothetical protein [Bacillus horti]MDQ0166411.1 hypothetical protein [Bacillus horti]
MQDFLIQYQWELFIGAEVLSFLCLATFLLFRYALERQKLGSIFLLLFFAITLGEAALAWFVYQQTGVIESFQIIVFIFILYACTFGIGDFKKLDRYIKKKVGKWKGKNLLTEKDMSIIKAEKDPGVIAKKYRFSWYLHALVFFVAHAIFWILYGTDGASPLDYVTDWSWFGEEELSHAPFQHETIMQVSRIWMIIFIIDTIWSWSYTIFPEKKKKEESV